MENRISFAGLSGRLAGMMHTMEGKEGQAVVGELKGYVNAIGDSVRQGGAPHSRGNLSVTCSTGSADKALDVTVKTQEVADPLLDLSTHSASYQVQQQPNGDVKLNIVGDSGHSAEQSWSSQDFWTLYSNPPIKVFGTEFTPDGDWRAERVVLERSHAVHDMANTLLGAHPESSSFTTNTYVTDQGRVYTEFSPSPPGYKSEVLGIILK